MSLDSLEVETKYDQARSEIEGYRDEVKRTAARAAVIISELSQFSTKYATLETAIDAIRSSTNVADQVAVSKFDRLSAIQQAALTNMTAIAAALAQLNL